MSARHRKCPTPDKIRYDQRAAALAALRAHPSAVRAYRCRGHYHLTTRPNFKPGR